MAQQLHRKNKTKAVTQSSLLLIYLGGKRLLKSTFGVNNIKTTLGNASKQDERGPWWNRTVLPSKKLDGSQTQLAGTLPSTREATVWPPGPRSSCISWRVFFHFWCKNDRCSSKNEVEYYKKKKGFLLGPVWLASAAIVRYLQSEWAPAHLYLIQLCLLLSLRKRLLDRGILLLSYVDNLYKSRRFSLSTGSP